MELIPILRELWHRRLLVIATLAVAIAAGLLVGFRISLSPPGLESRQYTVGLASAQLLIDTRDSAVVDLSPKGADVLSARSNLLANIMASDSIRSAVARDAGVPADRLAITTPSAAATAAETLLSTRAAQAAKGPSGYALNISTDPALPIITIAAQAPSAAGAARLAAAATAGLRQYISRTAAAQRTPRARRFVVTTLGAARAGEATRGPRHLLALAVALLIFALGCATIVSVSGIASAWREAGELERSRAKRGTVARGGEAQGDLEAVEPQAPDLSGSRPRDSHDAIVNPATPATRGA